MTCLICVEDCDHLADVKTATKNLEGFQNYSYENVTCPICYSLILEPMVMDNGNLIDRGCLLECLRSGGYDPQRPVKFAVPCVWARDEICRLIQITYGRQMELPPIGDVINAPEIAAFQESFAEVLERRRFRLVEVVDEVIPVIARNAAWRAERLVPRNEEVTLENEPVREGATPRRFYRTFLNQNDNGVYLNSGRNVNAGRHLTPENLFDSDATIDLTEDESIDLSSDMDTINQAEIFQIMYANRET